MKLSECIINVRDLTADQGGQEWDNFFIARGIDNAVRLMFRWQIEADPSYHNHEIDLDDANARQEHASVYAYDLPLFVQRITRIRRTKTSTERIGENVFHSDIRSNKPGFTMKHRTLMWVKGTTQARDYTLDVAKIPARLQAGTVPAAASTPATQMLFENAPTSFSATAYPHETDDDWYANSIIELTGVADSSPRDPVGQARRCVASTRVQDGVTANFRQELTFEASWTTNPAANDTYEMHPEVKDGDLRPLFLLAADQCFIQHRNIGGREMINPDLRREIQAFIDSIRPVQDLEPAFWADPFELQQGLDVDRDILLGLFPTGVF